MLGLFDIDYRPIPEFDGYFVTRDGKIWCNLGKGNRRKTDRTVELYEIKPRAGKNGYMRVYMRNTINNKRVDRYVHRLVAQTFVPNPKNKPCVNHRDCNRSNNHASNLEWVTYKENTTQTLELGHVEINEKGQFVGKVKAELWDSLLPSQKGHIFDYIVQKAEQNTRKRGV